MNIRDWIAINDLDARFVEAENIVNDIFVINDKLFCVVEYKDKFFDSKMNIVASADVDCDYFVYEFGWEYFYVPATSSSIDDMKSLRYFGKSINYNCGQVSLSIHGGYDLYNGSGSYSEWCEKAVFLGIKSLGIAEKNTIAGVISFRNSCAKYNIKPIIGVTVSIMKNDGISSLKLYAVNDIGWSNIIEIVNLKNTLPEFEDGITLEAIYDILESNPDGKVICVISYGSRLNLIEIEELKLYFHSLYYQIEAVKYNDSSYDIECLKSAKYMLDMFYWSVGTIKPVLINDMFFINSDCSHIRKILLECGKKREHTSDDAYLRSSFEDFTYLAELFDEHDERFDRLILDIIDNQEAIFEQCKDFDIVPNDGFHQPEFNLSRIEAEFGKFESKEDFLWELISIGIESRIGDVPEDVMNIYIDRIEYEVSIIKMGGFVDYFLILWDLIRWANRNKILTGIGRGSAGGSLLAYLLYITHIDSIKYDLPFERFINEGRIKVSLPDIDVDFEGDRRDDVKKYLEEVYGSDRVCSIGTFGKLKLRASMQKLCEDKISSGTVSYMTSLIIDENAGWTELFKSANSRPALKPFIKSNPEIIMNIKHILNQPSTESVHACATVILPRDKKNIFRWIPVKLNSDGMLISLWEGEYLEQIGLLKEDILGVKMLDKFRQMIDSIKLHHDVDIDIYSLPRDDERVYRLFQLGYAEGTFHFGSEGLTGFNKELMPVNEQDLFNSIALYRPAAIDTGSHIKFIKIRNGESIPEYDFMMESVLGETYGLFVYQEQVMKACQVLGGFTLTEADNIRRAMGKKKASLLESYKKQFIDNAVNINGCNVREANDIWSKLEVFAGYGFNKSHACAYAIMGYISQWFKVYYPVHYWYAIMDRVSDASGIKKDQKISKYLKEIQKINALKDYGKVSVNPPDVNKSGAGMTIDAKAGIIYWSLDKVRNVGDTTAPYIIDYRKTGEYYSMEDILNRIPKKILKKNVVENLILSGSFDSFIPNMTTKSQRCILFDQFRDERGLKGEEYNYYNKYINNKDESWWEYQQVHMCGIGMIDYRRLISDHFSNKLTNRCRVIVDDKLQSGAILGERVVISGIVRLIDEHKNKKGESFANIRLDCDNETIWVTMWSDRMDIIREEINYMEGNIMIFSGIVCKDLFKGMNVVQSDNKSEVKILHWKS